jgi:hypothetical protein
MLEYRLPSRRPKPLSLVPTTPVHHQYIPPKNVEMGNPGMLQESLRRDAIIKDLAASCKYKVGDVVKPTDPDSVKVYGSEVYVEAICDSYTKMGVKEIWPPSDCPMIVTAWSEKTKTRFICTPLYLSPK